MNSYMELQKAVAALGDFENAIHGFKPSAGTLCYHAFEQGMHAGHQGANHKTDSPYRVSDYKMWWMHGCIVGGKYRELDAIRSQLAAAQAEIAELRKPADLLVNVTGFDLLVRKCEHCQEHHIFGFYTQLRQEQKQIDRERMIVTINDTCKCGQPIISEYGLFTSPDGSAAKELAKVRQRYTASQGRLIEVAAELEKAKSENQVRHDSGIPFYCPLCGKESDATVPQGVLFASPDVPTILCPCGAQWRVNLYEVEP